VIDISTFPAPQGRADVRLLTSSSSVEDNPECNGGGLLNITGVVLDSPSQPKGGGFNSTVFVPLETPLQPGETILVNFLLGVQQTGRFRFFINVEALP
jgi:hypothetical protein